MPGSTPPTSQLRLAQLDDGNDCAILVQGDEGPAQVVQLGHRGTPSVICQRRWCHLLAACPIPSHRWREMDLNPRSPGHGGALLSGPLPLVAAKGGRRRSRHCGSARFLLLGKPFHRARGVHGFGGLRFVAQLGGLCVPAVQLIYTFAFHRLDQQFAERPYQGINAVR